MMWISYCFCVLICLVSGAGKLQKHTKHMKITVVMQRLYPHHPIREGQSMRSDNHRCGESVIDGVTDQTFHMFTYLFICSRTNVFTFRVALDNCMKITFWKVHYEYYFLQVVMQVIYYEETRTRCFRKCIYGVGVYEGSQWCAWHTSWGDGLTCLVLVYITANLAGSLTKSYPIVTQFEVAAGRDMFVVDVATISLQAVATLFLQLVPVRVIAACIQ